MTTELERLSLSVIVCTGHDDIFEPKNILQHVNTNSNKSSSIKNKLLGWHSPKLSFSKITRELFIYACFYKFCTFPQTLILKFNDGNCRIRKIQLMMHHFKIPCHATFYVAPQRSFEEEKLKFHRLGFVELSDNASTGYKTRELKTVDLDVEGSYLKLEFGKCHINKLNLYNQIALMAISILGQTTSLKDTYILEETAGLNHSLSRFVPENAAMWGVVNQSPILHQTMDLSWDLYQDETLRKALDALDRAKAIAVEEERFKEAKVFKKLHDLVLKAGKEVCSINASKLKALEQEDFDTAEAYKNDIEEIKASILRKIDENGYVLDDSELLEKPRKAYIPPTIQVEELTKNYKRSPTSKDRTPPKSKPSPNSNKVDAVVQSSRSPLHTPTSSSPKATLEKESSSKKSIDEAHVDGDATTTRDKISRTSPQGELPKLTTGLSNSLLNKNDNEASEESKGPSEQPQEEEDNLEPNPLTADQLKEFAASTKIFGDYIVECGVSKQFPLKERGAVFASQALDSWFKANNPTLSPVKHLKDKLFKYISSKVNVKLKDNILPEGFQGLDSAHVLNGGTTLCFTLIDDNREKAFTLGVALLEHLLSVAHACEAVVLDQLTDMVPILWTRAGDVNARIKQPAMDILSFIFTVYHKQPNTSIHFFMDVVKGKASSVHGSYRTIKSRFEVLNQLVKEFGLDENKDRSFTTGLQAQTVCAFAYPFLSHANNEVRDAVVDLFVSVAKESDTSDIEILFDICPELKQAKPQVISLIETKLGGNSNKKSDRQSSATRETSRTSTNRISHPTKKVDPKALARKHIEEKGNLHLEGKKGSMIQKKHEEKTDEIEVFPEQEKENGSPNSICVFCLERKKEFEFEEGLDIHYWRDCPLLSACPFCHKIIEISQLTKHLIRTCAKRCQVKQCPRCKEAIFLQEYATHIAKKTCEVSSLKSRRCPLCHKDVPSDDEAWRYHFMKRKCPGNIRTQSVSQTS